MSSSFSGQKYVYSVDNFDEKSLAWFELWTRSTHLNTATNEALMELLSYCHSFPADGIAVLIANSLSMLRSHQQKVMDRKEAIVKDATDRFGSEGDGQKGSHRQGCD